MNLGFAIAAIVWLSVFFTSLAEYGGVIALIGATLITGAGWFVVQIVKDESR